MITTLITLAILVWALWRCLPHLEHLQFPTPHIPSSRGEATCRAWLETYFKKPFPRVRPDWLKNPTTGKNLELDCYNQELGLAVEYNGQQHYHHTDQIAYTEYKDKLKRKLTEQQGVYLIVVPYVIQDIDAYLTQQISTWEALRNH